MTLRLAFGRPWRQTEGLLRSVARLMTLEIGLPDHTTRSRRSAAMPLALDLAGAKGSVGEILACVLTDKDVGDPTQVGPLLDQVAGDLASMTADGADEGDPV